MQDLLRAKEDSLFVFLSDVFLDQASVMKRLQVVGKEGGFLLAEPAPALYVFPFNFLVFLC